MGRCRVLIGLVVSLAACQGRQERAWHQAESLWAARDPSAFSTWSALDPSTPTGAEAHRRLTAAERQYREGTTLLAGGDARSRQVLDAASSLGPPAPERYLDLARACRLRGLDERAAAMYRKFLAQALPSIERDRAEAELAALHLDPLFLPTPTSTSPGPWIVLLVSAALGVLVVFWRIRRGPRRRAALGTLAQENPELQPAIAYLVGCLRHEFLKHRVLAIGDGIRAIAEGRLLPAERHFIATRLYGGEPLRLAWAGHLGSFLRSLGPRFDLERNDPLFREASRAVSVLAAGQAAIDGGDPTAARGLVSAHQRLVAFDETLAGLTRRLQHTVIDTALLSEISAGIQREVGGLPVEVLVAPLARSFVVESYRMDLELVLRNLLRNAVTHAASGPAPARVSLAIEVSVERTGEESMLIRIHDTNPAPLPAPRPLAEARGLALIQAALARCDGSLWTEAGRDGYAKCVVTRFFCALQPMDRAA